MAKHIDEFNDYGIKNPDGVTYNYTDYQRVSSLNDIRNFVPEDSAKNVQETQSYQETIQERGADFRSHSQLDLTNAPDLSNAAQSTASTSASTSSATAQATASSATAATTTAASATAATAASTTAATISTAAVSVGGAIASTVATLVVVATVVVNAFALGIKFLSATFNSLSFEVSIENNEDMEEFRAVLYDYNNEIVEELKISNSQIVVFNDLEEGKEYTFVVYDKDEIVKFKQAYLTSTRKSYEEYISIDITSKENGVLKFTANVPQEISKELYTLRVKDEKGKEYFAVDSTQEQVDYIANVPMDKDLIISISFGTRVVYQTKISKSIQYGVPTFDWDNMSDDKVMATFVSLDGSDTKQVEATITKTTIKDATLLENGEVALTANVTFDGKAYSDSINKVIPAHLNDSTKYSFAGFTWVDKEGLDAPTATAVFENKMGGANYEMEVTPTLQNDQYNEDERILTSAYNSSYEVAGVEYSDTHNVVLNEFVAEIGDFKILNYATGEADAYVMYTYNGLSDAQRVKINTTTFEPTEFGIEYHAVLRGVDLVHMEGTSDLYFEVEGNFYSLSEELDSFTISQVLVVDSNRTYEAPEYLFNIPVTTVGSYAFEVDDSMPEEQICNTVILNANIDNYLGYAFANSKVTSITFTNALTTIVDGMFSRSTINVSDILTDGITSIGKYAFQGAQDTSITIPDSVNTIGSGAFSEMRNLEEINTSMIGLDRDASYTVSGSSLDTYFASIFSQDDTWIDSSGYEAELVLNPSNPDDVKRFYVAKYITYNYTGEIIPDYAFSNNIMLDNITIPNATQIGDYAFFGVTQLDNYDSEKPLVIPNTVESIGDYAFAFKDVGLAYSRVDYCISLEDGDTPLEIGEHVFEYNDAMQSIVIPDRATKIGQYTFTGCYRLTEITAPFVGIEATSTGDDAIIGAWFSSIGVTGAGSEQIEMEMKYDNTTRFLPSDLRTVTISGDSLSEYAFSILDASTSSNSLLTTISIENVESIPDHAFEGCVSLSSITVGDALTSVGEAAFKGTAITSFSALGLEIVGESAFEECSRLTTVTFGGDIRIISDNAFNQCSTLSTVTYGSYDSLEDVGYAAFQGTIVSTFAIGANLKHLGAYSFNVTGDAFTSFVANTTSAAQIAYSRDDTLKWYCTNNPDRLMELSEFRNSFLSYVSDQEVKRSDY